MSDKPVYQVIINGKYEDVSEKRYAELKATRAMTRILYPASVVEALKAENEKLEAHYEGALDSIREHQQICNALKAENEELKEENRLLDGAYNIAHERHQKQNESQAKRIAELEKGLTEISEWTKRYTSPGHPISTVADRLLAASKNGDSK